MGRPQIYTDETILDARRRLMSSGKAVGASEVHAALGGQGRLSTVKRVLDAHPLAHEPASLVDIAALRDPSDTIAGAIEDLCKGLAGQVQTLFVDYAAKVENRAGSKMLALQESHGAQMHKAAVDLEAKTRLISLLEEHVCRLEAENENLERRCETLQTEASKRQDGPTAGTDNGKGVPMVDADPHDASSAEDASEEELPILKAIEDIVEREGAAQTARPKARKVGS